MSDRPVGTLRDLVLHPDPRLRARCAPAQPDDPALEDLVADLFATMYAAGGRGLAAPQVAVGLRVFVMDHDWKAGRSMRMAMVNPEVLEVSAERAAAEERCLSIPDRPVVVSRPSWARLAWRNPKGRRRESCLRGVAARIALHELDHLNGRLIVDD